MPCIRVLAAVAVAFCAVVDMATAEPERCSPVLLSGPESSRVSRGECPSAGLALGKDAVGEPERSAAWTFGPELLVAP
jgi:hypothetical protein